MPMPAQSTRRALPLLALLIACLATPVAADPQEAARTLVNAKARVLFMKHRRAIKALESTLRNPAFKAYFMTEDAEQRGALRADIEQSVLKVQRHFAVEEMCLIDRDGRELVRVVAGKLDAHLSDTEHENPFFAPALALSEGDTLVSDVYLSPDTGRWVLAYVTPIAVRGENLGLLHYEQEVVRVASELFEGLESGQALLGFDENGRVLFDSQVGDALPPANGSPLPSKVDGLTLQEIEAAAGSGATIGGAAVAVKRVRGWTLVALQR